MKTVTLPTHEQAYYELGSGTPLVLLHGYPFDHTMWLEQIEALSAKCRVIAPDLRGFGGSSISAGDVATGVAMEAYAEDLAQLLDAIKVEGPITLGGFSMGGYVMWQFARKHPQRIRAMLACDTRVIADSAEARQNRLATAEAVLQRGIQPVVEAMLPKLLSEATQIERPEVVQSVAAIMKRSSPEAVAAALRGMAVRPDVTELLPSLNIPALVVVGAEDAISSPAEMRGIADILPAGEFVEIPRSGHMTTCENPASVNAALLQFVARL